MFVIYALIIFIISNAFGKFLLNKDSSLYFLRAPFGFLIFLSILQIGYYPIEHFHLAANISFYYTFVITIGSFIFGLFNIKKEDFFFLKKKEFYILLIIIFGIVRISPMLDAGDDSFYMPFIMDNSIFNINTINPRNGWPGKIDIFYLYQGYYLFQSFLYKLQNSIFNGTLDIFVSFRSTMSLVCSIFASIMLSYVYKENKDKVNKYVLLLIEIFAILLTGVSEWGFIYWGSFMLYPIYVPLLIILYNEYLKDHDKKIKYAIFFANAGMVSLASSSLFLGLMAAFIFFVIEVFKKKVKCEDYYFMMLPLMFYAALYLERLWLLIIFAVIFILVLLLKKKLNKLVNNYAKYLIFIIPFVEILLSHSFTWSEYRIGYSILLFVLGISFVLGYFLVTKKELNNYAYVFILTVIFFFNPLVATFISKYTTTSDVYYRVYFLIKNPIMIITILSLVYSLFNKKVFKTMFIIILSILTMYYGYNFIKNAIVNNKVENYNYYYREDNDSLELGKFINEINEGNILSVYFAPRVFNEKLKSVIYRYPEDIRYTSDNILKVIYYGDGNYDEFYNYFIESKYNYLITYNYDKIVLGDDFKEIYHNNTYKVYELIKE